ncbi:chemotaxis-specific protein-glutamate methyltransferase CheB [Marinomonas mediterranea]|uniref:protein-glutamate methylesterase/protein-glutamine glutaminase n=1 Tax=Marinomonas mediterranea TaxID=119864 RepID=UPI00234B23E3|nr:chemotaxis response regulator protein-glutamate methylesterase [Marinomonas mediterranea]WCN12490.1 chemotaxis-specific protein-glutamate methyltransferase CheB [Marinomonas mediterranea]
MINPSNNTKIKVLVVDDSASIRSLLSDIIERDSELILVAAAADAFEAKEMVNVHKPDVITLDIEMPKVDGLRFLEVLMKARPTPVVMISTLTKANADVTLRALELGAVDYIAKPVIAQEELFKKYCNTILRKIKVAAKANVLNASKALSHVSRLNTAASAKRIVAIGASTGGTEAIKRVLASLPPDNFAVLITQHMPPGFTTTFAERLNSISGFTVTEAKGNENVLPGNAYLAPGDQHLSVIRRGSQLVTRLSSTDKVSGHRPSVDVLFDSVASEVQDKAIGVILTGMGRDGADGLLSMRSTGAFTVAQDEASCVVFGMPKEAVKQNAAVTVVSLDEIANVIVNNLK